MLKHHASRQIKSLPWWTITIGAVVLLLHFTLPSLGQKMQMDRTSVCEGALWQLISGHFVHWNAEHLFADLAVFAGIGYFIEKQSSLRFITLFLLSALSISLAVLISQPEIQIYRGLSGIDMALAAYWTLDNLRQSLPKRQVSEIFIWSVALAGILSKPVIEIIIGHPIFVQDLGSNVVGCRSPTSLAQLSGLPRS